MMARMDEDLKQKLQITLVIAILLVTARTAYIFYERKQASTDGAPREAAGTTHHELTADDYVYERPFYGYDLASAKKDLVGQNVWMKAGNYFRLAKYEGGRVAKSDNADFIPPLQAMKITDVVLKPSGDHRELYAIFTEDSKPGTFAVPIGVEKNDQYRFDVQNVLFRQDPRQLYKHWRTDIWAAIDRHEALKGMNEQQVWLALGYGTPLSDGDYGDRKVHYENAGKPKEVRFEKNAAVEISDAASLAKR
jgi:hypothetical protein